MGDEQQGIPDGWVIVDEPPMAVSHAQPGTSAGLALAMAGRVVPAAAHAAMEVATNPAVPRAASVVGQIAGGTQGLMHGGPLAAAGGTWTGGKAGWFTGKLAQKLAAPVAAVAEKVAPYAQTLSTLGGAAGVGDLAQMADPNRRDIGFLGIGASVDPDVTMLKAAVAKGANPTQAAAQLVNGDPQKFAALITAYSQSLGQGR